MGNDHVYITDREGNLESQTNSLAPYVLFNNGSFLFGGWEYNAEGLKEPFEIRDDVEIPVGEYRFNRVNASFAFDQSRRIAPSVFYSDGQFYNGTLRSISLGVETKLCLLLTALVVAIIVYALLNRFFFWSLPRRHPFLARNPRYFHRRSAFHSRCAPVRSGRSVQRPRARSIRRGRRLGSFSLSICGRHSI